MIEFVNHGLPENLKFLEDLHPRTKDSSDMAKRLCKGVTNPRELKKILLGLKLSANYFGDAGFPIFGIYRFLSFINHSCSPNSNYTLDPKTKLCQLLASRDIKAGEEITYAYGLYCNSRYHRMKIMEDRHLFVCKCQACADDINLMEDVDIRRVFIVGGNCVWCGKFQPKERCAKCKIYYCSTECQKADWKSGHKSICKKLIPEVEKIRRQYNLR